MPRSQRRQRTTCRWHEAQLNRRAGLLIAAVDRDGMDPPGLPAGHFEKTRSCQAVTTGDREGYLSIRRCRRNDVARLRRSDVRDDTLVLAGAKTGPRNVPLNARAGRIFDGRPRRESPFVFRSARDPWRPIGEHLPLWYRVRREAGIEDVRLHDLRHTHASHAVMNGVPVPVVSRLLGHSSIRMTLRYAHLGDRDIEAAAERVGETIGTLLGV